MFTFIINALVNLIAIVLFIVAGILSLGLFTLLVGTWLVPLAFLGVIADPVSRACAKIRKWTRGII